MLCQGNDSTCLEAMIIFEMSLFCFQGFPVVIMATALSPESKSGRDGPLVCSICLEEMMTRRPKALTCLHTFCEECLIGLSRTEEEKRKNELSCPTCRKITLLPTGGAKALPINFMIQSFYDSMCSVDVKDNEIGEGEICSTCAKQKKRTFATFKCEECDIILCGECKLKHSTYKIFENHTLTAIAQNKCKKHGKEIKSVCTFCPQETCVDCVMLGDHQAHAESIKDYTIGLNEAKEQASDLFKQLTGQSSSLTNNIKSTERREVNIGELKRAVKAQAIAFQRRIAESEKELLDALESAYTIPTADRLSLLKEEHDIVAKHIQKYKKLDGSVQPEMYLKMVTWIKGAWEDTMLAKGNEEPTLEALPKFAANPSNIEIGRLKKS